MCIVLDMLQEMCGVAHSMTWSIGTMWSVMQNIKVVGLHVQRLTMCITI